MGENKAFLEALKNFTHDAASGGAIEHLAGLGYLPQEIESMLDFPTPYHQVQETYWDYLVKNRIVVEDTEELKSGRKKEYFVKDYDAIGKPSFRRVVEYEKNDAQGSYVSCDFGMRMKREPETYLFFLEPLDDKQRMYMEGVLWPRKEVWHLLDERMSGIIEVLKAKSHYQCEILKF